MSPFDIAVFTFFIVLTAKAIDDTFAFWRAQEAEARRQYAAAARKTQAHRAAAKRAKTTAIVTPIKRAA